MLNLNSDASNHTRAVIQQFFGVILLAIGVKLITTNLGSMIQNLG